MLPASMEKLPAPQKPPPRDVPRYVPPPLSLRNRSWHLLENNHLRFHPPVYNTHLAMGLLVISALTSQIF